MSIQVDHVVDAKGLACPMPIVRTKKAMNDAVPGQVIEVQATDKGSLADLQAWAKSSGHHYLGTIEEEGVLKHYVRKASEAEEKEEMNFPHTINNDELLKKLEANEELKIIDVRESAEYHFGHIPGSISIPLGELDSRVNELSRDDDIYVICRSGNRSDFACKLLQEKGFNRVKNVVQGLIQWNGPLNR